MAIISQVACLFVGQVNVAIWSVPVYFSLLSRAILQLCWLRIMGQNHFINQSEAAVVDCPRPSAGYMNLLRILIGSFAFLLS